MFEIEEVEDPLEQRQRTEERHVDAQELRHGPEKPGQQPREGHHRTQRGLAADNPMTAVPVHHDRRERPEQAHAHAEPTPHHRPAHVQAAYPPIRLVEPGDLFARPAERLHKENATHGERLLHLAVHQRDLLLGGAHQLSLQVSNPAHRNDEERQEGDREERQPPIQGEHQGERRGDRDHVADDAPERVADDALDGADIVRHA